MKLTLVLSVVLFSASFALGQEQTTAQKPKPPAPASLAPADNKAGLSPAEKYFSDVELLDQDGRTVHFYSDVLKNKVVIINTFYTTCTSICPPLNRTFEKI